ncbi:MAG: hypothetical protein J0L66_05385 [Cytophagales bacterium]|nr:hypothetical protein [Cytophagales bacterium]
MRENFFKQTIAIRKGESQLPPVLEVIFQRMRESYSINPINVAFETRGTLYSQSITIAFVTKAEQDKAWPYAEAIQSYFFDEIFKTENRTVLEPYGEILTLRQKRIPEATFSFVSLEEAALLNAIAQLGKGYESLVTRYPNLLWKVRYAEGRFIIFFFTEQQQKESGENGTTEKIMDELIQLLKQHDELTLIDLKLLLNSQKIISDSKENYDTNFGGADWIYFR